MPMPEYKTYRCEICGFTYDEEAGLPEHGIAAATLWNVLPADWTCPECDANKENFGVVP
jgi:rubredoxin